MRNIFIPILSLSLCCAFNINQQESSTRIPVLVSKVSTLVFPQEIIDVEIASPNYHLKVKGRYLLLRAKSAHATPSSIFVRFGKDKTAYVAEIFPQDNAPLQLFITSQQTNSCIEQTPTLTTDLSYFNLHLHQQYFDCGIHEKTLRIILTQLMHTQHATFIRLFVDNLSAIDLLFESPTFEYLSLLKTSFFRTQQKTLLVEPILAPDTIAIAHQQAAYLLFAIPTWASSGGLQITLTEAQGERTIQLCIPAALFLQPNSTPQYG